MSLSMWVVRPGAYAYIVHAVVVILLRPVLPAYLFVSLCLLSLRSPHPHPSLPGVLMYAPLVVGSSVTILYIAQIRINM